MTDVDTKAKAFVRKLKGWTLQETFSRKRLRQWKEKLFQGTSFIALSSALGALFFLLTAVLIKGYETFFTTEIHLSLVFPTPLTPETMDKSLSSEQLKAVFADALITQCPYLKDPADQAQALELISWGANQALKTKLQERFAKNKNPLSQINLWVLSSDETDLFYKGKSIFFPSRLSNLPDISQKVIETFRKHKIIRLRFNINFLSSNDSTAPELAGIYGAFWGSVFVLLISFAFAFPLGIGTALYIEELASRNWWVTWVDVKLNNMASIPSILFGLLGFMLFDYWLELPRPSSLIGGLTIGAMMAPLLMVTTRVALQSVPKNVRIASQALGATKAQTMIHHVLPIAFPQIITSTILALARASGETAPLLMVGMIAFVGNTPSDLTSPATTLPAQIFSWSRNAEVGFLSKASGGILALFFLLLILNGCAFYLRRFFQRVK